MDIPSDPGFTPKREVIMLSRLFGRRAAQNPAPFEHLEQRAMMAADLSIAVGGLQTVNVQGATNIKLPVTVTNVGNSPLTGGGRVEFFLSTDRTLDDNDYLFNTSPLPRIGRPGTAARFTLNTPTPADLAPRVGRALAAGDYFVIARVVANRVGADTRQSNNVAATTAKATVSYDFGRVGNRTDVALSLTMPDGSVARIGLNGPGVGRVFTVDNRLTIVVEGTDHRSQLTMHAIKGNPTIDGLVINGSMQDVLAQSVNVRGDIDISGSIGALRVRDLTNSRVSVRGFGEWDFQAQNVTDSRIAAPFMATRGLLVNQWWDTDSTADTVSVRYIKDLKSNADFGATMLINGTHKTFAVQKVNVGGKLFKGAWNLAGRVETFTVGGIAQDWGGTIGGEINSVFIQGNLSGNFAADNVRRFFVNGSIINANVLIGARLGNDGKVGGTGANADTFVAGRIGVFEVRGGISNSIISTGLTTTDAVLLDDDDRVVAGSKIDSITVRRSVTNSKFVSESVPTRAKINNRTVTTGNNSTFIRTLP
jgi:hypothetical protein